MKYLLWVMLFHSPFDVGLSAHFLDVREEAAHDMRESMMAAGARQEAKVAEENAAFDELMNEQMQEVPDVP
jgi:hypothetical protein